MRASLVTSSSSSTVTACNGVLAAPQLPATPSHRPGEEHLGESVEHSTSTSSRTPQFVSTAPSHTKNITVLPQQQQNIRNHTQQNTLEAKWSTRPSQEQVQEKKDKLGQEQARRWRTSRRQARSSRPARSKSATTAAVHSHTFAQLQAKVATVQKYHC
jgi:Na+-translocating ferredoxin:NAD+ oxidoreductase RnfC subunit